MRLFSRIVASIVLFTISLPALANTGELLREETTLSLTRLIEYYENRIRGLESENAALRSQLNQSSPLSIVTASGSLARVIVSAIEKLPNLLSENSLPANSRLGMIEFVQGAKSYTIDTSVGAIFLNIEDPNAPTSTAFHYKVLYEYSSDMSMTRIGLFEMDAKLGRYTTKWGYNPYSATKRLKVISPRYTGKITDPSAQTIDLRTGVITERTPSTTTPAAVIPTVTPAPATVAKPATPVVVTPAPTPTPAAPVSTTSYDSVVTYNTNNPNDPSGIIKRANAYLSSNPPNAEILRIRAYAYYQLSKYSESLQDFDTIDRLGKTTRAIACVAAAFAQDGGLTERAKYYSGKCGG